LQSLLLEKVDTSFLSSVRSQQAAPQNHSAFESSAIKNEFLKNRIAKTAASIASHLDTITCKSHLLQSMSFFLQSDPQDKFWLLWWDTAILKETDDDDRSGMRDTLKAKRARRRFDEEHCMICFSVLTGSAMLWSQKKTVSELVSVMDCQLQPLQTRLEKIAEKRKYTVVRHHQNENALIEAPPSTSTGKQVGYPHCLWGMVDFLINEAENAEAILDPKSSASRTFLVCEECFLNHVGPQLSLSLLEKSPPPTKRPLRRSLSPSKAEAKQRPFPPDLPHITDGRRSRSVSKQPQSSKIAEMPHSLPRLRQAEAREKLYSKALIRYQEQCQSDNDAIRRLETTLILQTAITGTEMDDRNKLGLDDDELYDI
jgi:hypothetical protein